MKSKIISIVITGLTIAYNPSTAFGEECIDRENTAREPILKYPDNSNNYYDLGAALICQIRFTEALDAYRQGVNFDTNFAKISATEKEAEIYAIFAYALGKQKQLYEAIAAYNKAIELTPDRIELYNRSTTQSSKTNFNPKQSTFKLRPNPNFQPTDAGTNRWNNGFVGIG
jgi:tetratricopeptide (TPR) repeat protein